VKPALALFAAGAALLFPFEYPVTLAAGVVLLFASIVVGVFALASPEYLAGDD
jgi:hypothetical protein